MVMEEKIIYGTEEAVAKLIMEFMKSEGIKAKLLSDLSPEEINVLTLLSTMGEKLKIDVLKRFCMNFCQYRVSKDSKGRKEMVGIATYTVATADDRKGKKSIKDLFSGLR